MVKPPCKDCKDRTASCHSKCEKYKEYRIKHEEEIALIHKQKELENSFYHERSNKVHKVIRKKR